MIQRLQVLKENSVNSNNPEIELSSEEETLVRIKANAAKINFNKIGVSSGQIDDLKLIKGIGPFIEKKLNALGIYEFPQIAKLDEEDMDNVNEAIEFFPGRVKRDNWKEQANELLISSK